jgi:cysteine synthase A
MLQRVTPYEPHTLPPAFGRLAGLIGNTPMIRLDLMYKGEARTVLAKRECGNLSGSIKDRMAFEVLSQAYLRGELCEGDTIVEATSGNAGIALSALGQELGHPVVIYMPDWMSVERIQIMKGYGAEVRLVSREEGGFLGAIAKAEEIAQQEGVFAPRQFTNEDNIAAHAKTTGPEILRSCRTMGVTPAAFVAGVGTGGTVMGCARSLRTAWPSLRAHPVEPAESPTLSTGYKVGAHRIQGVSDDFIPEILKLDELDDVISIHDGDGILMAQKLSRDAGLGVGISSGANVIAALKAATDSQPVVTILCDCSKKYLSTDLAKVEPVGEGYVTPDVELVGVEVV